MDGKEVEVQTFIRAHARKYREDPEMPWVVLNHLCQFIM